jgi:hypothetical protein
LASTTRCWRTGIYFLVRLHRPITIGYFYIDAINIIASRVGRYEKKRKETWFRHEISWPYTIGHYANINKQKRRAFDGFFSCLFHSNPQSRSFGERPTFACAPFSPPSQKFPNWKQLGSSRETFWIE